MSKQIDRILFGIGINSWNRFQTFLDLVPIIRGKTYWYALRTAYESSDNLYLLRDDVKASFLRNEPEREFLMTPKEIEFLKKLPERISIYRGMTEAELKHNSFGCSWTLKKEVAEFFAFTNSRNLATSNLKKTVHELTIDKNEVIAFFNGRKEFEIIYINDNSVEATL